VSDHVLQLRVHDRPGVLHLVTGVIAGAGVLITGLELGASNGETAVMTVELAPEADLAAMAGRLLELPEVLECTEPAPFESIFGSRVIVIGGGAQVAAVASGAVQEADRHNIRGERISVDTIPLVGETEIAEAVRAVARLPRAKVLVLAGSIMGGELAAAVSELRERGIPVISLNQVGSVVEVCDLVVSDPLQAGVMAVMAIASTARFDLHRVRGRSF